MRKAHRRETKRRRRLARATGAAAGGLGLAGLALIALAFATPPPSSAPPAPEPVSSFGSADPDAYAGSPSTPPLPPSTLAIPDVGLQAPIVEEATDQNGYLVLPESTKTAHYTRSARLGAAHGSSIVAGHVNYADGAPAPMAAVARVAKGMPAYVVDTAGTTHRYRITSLQSLPKTGLPQSFFTVDGPAQLVLITCDTSSPIAPIAGVAQYADNTVATAIPWPWPRAAGEP